MNIKRMKNSKYWPEIAQGARCGHVEARDRVSQYVIDEEKLLGDAAARENVTDGDQDKRAFWYAGYCYGYRLRVSGECLSKEIVDAPLPQRKG